MFSDVWTIFKVRFQLRRAEARVSAIARKSAILEKSLADSSAEMWRLKGVLARLERELDAYCYQWAKISKEVKEDGAKGE